MSEEPKNTLTQREFARRMYQSNFEKNRVTAKLIEYCRMLRPLLLDKQMSNVAEELGSLLFQLDAADQETQQMINDNREVALSYVRRSMDDL